MHDISRIANRIEQTCRSLWRIDDVAAVKPIVVIDICWQATTPVPQWITVDAWSQVAVLVWRTITTGATSWLLRIKVVSVDGQIEYKDVDLVAPDFAGLIDVAAIGPGGNAKTGDETCH